MAGRPIRVVLVDDHEIALQGLKAILAGAVAPHEGIVR
jgi:YesN/AraC family two-component response regulator